MTIYQTFGFGLASILVIGTLIFLLCLVPGEIADHINDPRNTWQKNRDYLFAWQNWLDKGMVGEEPTPPGMPGMFLANLSDPEQKTWWHELYRRQEQMEKSEEKIPTDVQTHRFNEVNINPY